MQTIPRTLWLDKGIKQLIQWPIREINTLRGQKFQVRNQELKTGEYVNIPEISAAQVCFSLFMSNNKVSGERFQRDVFFSKIEAIYRYNYILKIRS